MRVWLLRQRDVAVLLVPGLGGKEGRGGGGGCLSGLTRMWGHSAGRPGCRCQ